MVGFLYDSGAPLELELIVLDKDGTLVEFARTWLPGFRECAQRVAATVGEPALEPALLKAGGWVEEESQPPRVTQEGLMLHGTLEELARAWIDTQPLVAAHFCDGKGADGCLLYTSPSPRDS